MSASEAIADSLFSWLDAAGNVNTLDVDVVMSTTDKRTAQLTDHVVETGSVVTDHIVIKPESLNFELVVSQTPMAPLATGGFEPATLDIEVQARSFAPAVIPINVRKSQFRPGGFLALSTGIRNVLAEVFGGSEETPTTMQGSTTKVTTSKLQVRVLQATGGPVDRVNDTFDTLIEIMNTGLLVTVSFKGRLYLDYLLTSVELSQGPKEGGMGRFKVEARAFRAVTGTVVALPDPADFRALPAVKKGNTPTKTPDPDPKKRGKTFLKRGAKGIDKLFGVPQ
jgi:hypothetical protein